MTMERAFKNAFHRGLRVFGFDVVALKNLDAAIESREKERRRRYLKEIAEIRKACERCDLCLGPNGRGRRTDRVVWVQADELKSSACAMMRPAHTVLDVGCAFRPQPFVEAAIHICCEPHKEYLDRLIIETSAAGKYVYIHCGLEHVSRMFPASSVDSVFLIDVIEHLEQQAALDCLGRLKRIARHQVLLFTPIGYMPQEPRQSQRDAWGMSGGEWQRHRSGWGPEDFPTDDGWSVVACKEYHFCDAYGEKLENPIGAMWAIWDRKSHPQEILTDEDTACHR